VCLPLTTGKHAGQWCPFGRGPDQADDQSEDDAQSLVFETPPLPDRIELLGAPVLTVELSSDKPVATLIARLCDVHPGGQSLRTSFGVLNLTHRDSHAAPSALVPGERYTVRLQLNDCGASIPAGHRLRLALSTSYWPMVWPAPEIATVTIHAGTLDLPIFDRPLRPIGTEPPIAFEPVETAPAQRSRQVKPGVVVWDHLDGLETGTHFHFEHDLKDGDPTSAVVAMRRTGTLRRGDWRTRIETSMRMTCSRETFRVEATMQAFDGDTEVCARKWDRTIKRDLV